LRSKKTREGGRLSVMRRTAPSFKGLMPKSAASSASARASSNKRSTQCERVLQRSARQAGLRFTTNDHRLTGVPDLVFAEAKLLVFCDGDFWHGRRLAQRIKALAAGHNAPYWIAKISTNVARDKRVSRKLRSDGWSVMRIWESDILDDPVKVIGRIRRRLDKLQTSSLKQTKNN
jgi:DNA mismatch endonuclease, patch repair protein